MLLREGPDLEGLPDELRPLIESCMQMDPTARPNPADLQAQLAPHLFGSGSDDSGTASAWLPERAVSLIEARRGGRPARPPQNSGRSGGGARPHVPPPPPHDPVVPPPPPQRPRGRGGTGPVRLAGAAVPIGPGPRVADTRAAAVQAPPPAAALAATWTKPRPGVNGTEPAAPAHPAPAAPPESPGGWRPWRFRMSNDVWGTPAVAGDLVYVTSFEVHALDVATGRRRFKTRDVAWSMAVADGRIHASDGPTLYALDAREGGDLWRLNTDAWVYSLKADRGTVLTGTRGGGVQGWEASTGQKLWELTGCQTDFESPEAGPALFDGTAYVWQDARLRALDARTGEERWSYPIGDAASCGGVPVRLTAAPDGYVYVCAGTRVLALEAARGTSAGTSRPRRSSCARPPSCPAPRSPAAACTSPTTSARCTPWTPPTAATAGASPPRRAPRWSRCWSPRAMSTWAAARASTRWTRSPARPSGASSPAARSSARPRSPRGGSTSAPATTCCTR